MGLAFVHIVGALALTVGFWFAVAVFYQERVEERIKWRYLQDASLALGIPVSALDRDEAVPRFIDYMAKRYDSELFRNRLSDLCETIVIAWGWFGLLAQVAAIVIVFFSLLSDGSRGAVGMWSVLAIAVFTSATSIAAAVLCQTLTGRIPGEARRGRTAVALLMENRLEESVGKSHP